MRTKERFHAGHHEEGEQDCSTREGGELGRTSASGVAPNYPPQRVPESKRHDGGSARRDTGVEHAPLYAVGRPGAAYEAKVRASGHQEGEHRTEPEANG
jgi:hypothetical protein